MHSLVTRHWAATLRGPRRIHLQRAQSRCVCRVSTHYDVLGVAPQASPSEVKQAFRKLALKLHPDVNQEAAAAKQFIKVKEAYEILSDAGTRAAYDRQFRVASSSSSRSSSYNPSQSPWASTRDSAASYDDDLAWIFQNAGIPIEVVEMYVGWEDLVDGSSSGSGAYRTTGGASTSGRSRSSSSSSSSSRPRGRSKAAGGSKATSSSSSSSSSGAAGREAAGAAGSKAGRRGAAQAQAPLAFDLFMAELDDEMQQCLIEELLELPDWERDLLLQDLQEAETTTEVRSLLAEALGISSGIDADEYSGYYEVLSRSRWSPWEVDALEAMDTAAFWHKNAGAGSRPRGFKGGARGEAATHSTFTFWEEAAAGRGGRRGKSQRAGPKRKGKDLDLDDIDIDDVDAYNAWVRAVGAGGSQEARRRSRRSRRR